MHGRAHSSVLFDVVFFAYARFVWRVIRGMKEVGQVEEELDGQGLVGSDPSCESDVSADSDFESIFL